MRSLRHFALMTRLVLAWLVLSLGAAVASPIVKPQDVLLVCSSSGAMKVVVQADDDSSSGGGGNTMDCPLCAPFVSPLLSATRLPEPGWLPALAVSAPSDSLRVDDPAATLAARGPPVL